LVDRDPNAFDEWDVPLNIHLQNEAVQKLLGVSLEKFETYTNESKNADIHSKIFVIGSNQDDSVE